MILPRNDRVLIQRIEEQRSSIVLTDADKSLKGKVLAVGPGRWIPGEYWWVKHYDVVRDSFIRKWEWVEGHREPVSLMPGDIVHFSSKWNDLAGDHYEDLPLEADPMLHLVQEADVFARVGPQWR